MGSRLEVDQTSQLLYYLNLHKKFSTQFPTFETLGNITYLGCVQSINLADNNIYAVSVVEQNKLQWNQMEYSELN